MRALVAMVCAILVGCSSAPEPEEPNQANATPPSTTSTKNAGEREACEHLAGDSLELRIDAMHALQAKAGLAVGGTEQQLELVGAWCVKNHGIRPPWLQSR